MNRKTFDDAKALCRDLRKNQTKNETMLWNALRGRKFHGYKFLRQHPVFVTFMNKESFYIADFYCREQKLIIEIDGKHHAYNKRYDELRTEIIKNFGVNVVRFKDEEIEKNLPKVLKQLEEIVCQENHIIFSF